MRRENAENLEKYQIVEKSDETASALQVALQGRFKGRFKGQKRPLATASQGACKAVEISIHFDRQSTTNGMPA